MERSKAELNYIDQRTRQLIARWADHALRTGGIPDLDSIPKMVDPAKGRAMHDAGALEMHREYFDHAVEKGWVGKTVKDGKRQLTSGGWSTAAAFLKR
jgi:hypothetical protein